MSHEMRAVMVVGWVLDEQAVPVDGESATLVPDRDEVLAILADAGRGRPASMALDGAAQAWRVVLGALTAVAPHGGARIAGLIAQVPAVAQEEAAGSAGRTAALWFPHPSGLIAFRARVSGAARDRIFLETPDCVLRYSRRAAPRAKPPQGHAPAVTIPLQDGTWIRDLAVVDVSATGLAVLAPVDLDFPAGGITRIGMCLPDDRWLPLMVRCRNTQPFDLNRNRLGLELLDPPVGAVHAIERYLATIAPVTATASGGARAKR